MHCNTVVTLENVWWHTHICYIWCIWLCMYIIATTTIAKFQDLTRNRQIRKQFWLLSKYTRTHAHIQPRKWYRSCYFFPIKFAFQIMLNVGHPTVPSHLRSWHFPLFPLSPRAQSILEGQCQVPVFLISDLAHLDRLALHCFVRGLIFIDLKLTKLFLNKHFFLYITLASEFLAQYSPEPLCKKRQ